MASLVCRPFSFDAFEWLTLELVLYLIGRQNTNDNICGVKGASFVVRSRCCFAWHQTLAN